ncbi:hypothetical protein VIGAN_09195600 [Vigna angularis var. angularis]|uniref:Uncharacterized protein n=1 Tax=Vigna angularis var. angularis TaxID=157739 RepID=A0A0S3SZH3_PHAAN|nr:hypothetical protein VIGAN_09195600 [Vigna angularis var. angularis]
MDSREETSRIYTTWSFKSQIEALTAENQRLNGKLENALGKIEVVCYNVIIVGSLHLDLKLCTKKYCYLILKFAKSLAFSEFCSFI